MVVSIRSVSGLLVGVLAVALTLGGCTAPASRQSGCPASWDSAVVWSTESGDGSQLQFFSGGTLVGSRRLPYLGISSSHEFSRDGHTVLLMANGAGGIGEVSAVRFDTESCTVDATPVGEQVVLAEAVSGPAFYTASWLNGSARVHRHEFGTTTDAEADLAGVIVSALAISGDRLYAFGIPMRNASSAVTSGSIYVLDAATLKQVGNITVPQDKTQTPSAAVVAGLVVFPITGTSSGDNAGHWLGVLDPATGKVRLVDLGVRSPYGVTASGQDVFVAHTFLNPAHGALSQYRKVTRYDTGTGTVTTATVSQGVRRLAVGTRSVLALSTDDSSDYLLELGLPAMTQTGEWRLSTPDGQDYAAGVLVP